MELLPYQIENGEKIVELIKKHNVAYYAGQVRVRKTGSALYAIKRLGHLNALLITKKNAIDGIFKQYYEFGFDNYYKLTCINYESADKIIDGRMPCQYTIVVVDEAHSLGAYPKKSKRTEVARVVCDQKPIIYMSGTPTPESYSQIYHQFYISSFTPFDKYKSFYKWAKDFVDVKQKIINGLTINDYSKADEDKIKQHIDHLFVKFSQEDAGFKGKVVENVLHVPMHENIYKLANLILKKRVYRMKNGSLILADTAAKLQNKLHQIYSGTIIDDDGNYHILDRSKANYIKSKFPNQRLAIFYLFKSEGEMLKQAFPNWTEDDAEFNNDPGKTWIKQVVSGREGVNVSKANALVFFNIAFSATTYWQARARSQDKDSKDVMLYWVFSRDGIEEKVYKAVKAKKSYTVNYFKRHYNPPRPPLGFMATFYDEEQNLKHR